MDSSAELPWAERGIGRRRERRWHSPLCLLLQKQAVAIDERGGCLQIGVDDGDLELACFQRATPRVVAESLAQFGADIIAAQEDLEFGHESAAYRLPIPGYNMVARCRTEEILGHRTAVSEGSMVVAERNLHSARQVCRMRRRSVVALRHLAVNASSAPHVPRCMAVVDVRVKDLQAALSPPLRVASTHLAGERFADEGWEEHLGAKASEARAMLAALPDIIAGDLNSYSTAVEAADSLREYDVFSAAVAAGKAEQFLAWATEAVDELRRSL